MLGFLSVKKTPRTVVHVAHQSSLQKQRGRAKDPVKLLLSIEQRARERQVAYETVKILRTKVIECYRREGVNHYDNCKEPVAAYYNVIIRKDLGQLQPDWANPEKMDG